MFKTAKFVYQIVVLLFAVYLIELGGMTPMVSAGVAVVLIAGADGLEAYLIRQGVLADGGRPNGSDSEA